MESVYVTDGSFEGLLSAIHEMYYSQDTVTDILFKTPAQLNFAMTYKNIQTNEEKAFDVYNAICRKISHRASYEVTMTWLSELPQCGREIINYIKLGFKVGKKIDSMLTHKHVLPVHKASQKVSRENLSGNRVC